MKKTILFLASLLLVNSSFSQTFTPQNSGITGIFSSINFVDDNVGMAATYGGEIVKTINGGTNWDQQNSGVSSSLRDVLLLNSTTALALGDGGVILKTTNGGTLWSPVNSGTSSNLVKLFLNASTIFAVGANGTILKSTNSGSTWTSLNSGTSIHLKSIWFENASVGYAGGEYKTILKTTNGGTSWTNISTDVGNPINYQLTGMYFSDANTGFAVGGNAQGNQGLILKTTNAGATWTSEYFANNYFGSIQFLNNATGFIAGGNITNNTSTILKTNNGGSTWVVQPTSSSRQVGVSFPSFNAGYTCGLDGTILKIMDINLGIENYTSDTDINAFPNPNNGRFALSFGNHILSGNGVAEVYNVRGEVILKQDPSEDFDISNLANGIYFIRVTDEHFTATKKVVKE
jgi:photosystem II stability/assembly factor-like uncharacterized protein